MKLNTLKPAAGSVKSRKRVGRGEGSGLGSTSGRGYKGAQSRSGYSRKAGFEGGQMPLQRRLPKFGFKSLDKTVYTALNLDLIQELVERLNTNEFTFETFRQNGLASGKDKVKILGRGELKAKVSITAHAFSKSAIAAIEAQGGVANKM